MKISAFSYTSRGGRAIMRTASARVEGERGVFVVADGLGGHQSGEVASALAADTLFDSCLQAETLDGDGLTACSAPPTNRSSPSRPRRARGT